MKNQRDLVDMAFKQSLHLICERFGIGYSELTLVVKFIEKKIELIVCSNDIPQSSISIQSLVGSKMVGIRLTANDIRNIFRSVQYTFSTEKRLNDTDCISLLMYDSKKAKCPCLGVYIGGKPINNLRVSSIIAILGIGKELLN